MDRASAAGVPLDVAPGGDLRRRRVQRLGLAVIYSRSAAVAVVVAAVGGLMALAVSAGVSRDVVFFAAAAATLGAAVGVTELISRYRDSPGTVIGGIPGLLYVGLNALASLGAFAAIRALDWRFGVEAASGDSTALRVTQLLVAGVGSAALFRSSLFTIKAGDQDISVGPSAILTTALQATDRAADRRQALWRSARIRQVMRNVEFEAATTQLVPYCLQVALQNVTPDEAKGVANLVSSLKTNAELTNPVKSMILGGALLSIVGYDVLYYAVQDLCEEIRRDPERDCVP